MLLVFLLAGMGGCAEVATAQGPTTTVQDTVYTATGAPAAGTVVVSWGAFTTAGGVSIPAGSTSVTLGAGGALSVALAPNAGGTPMGSYYTAVFHLSDGTTSKQYWVVPVTVPGGGPAKLVAIQNSVLPTTVAMQTVSKQYVDNAIAQAQIGAIPLASSPYVLKAGDAMTGPLELPADPVSPLQAADKNYVDENVAAVTSGLTGTVRTLPPATQTVAQPSGTQLGVNLLNGELYASQYVSGTGNNGIANALSSADCASGCKVVAEPTYNSTENAIVGGSANGTVVEDERGGSDGLVAVNPLSPGSSFNAARGVAQINTLSQQQLNALRPGTVAVEAATEQLSMSAETGGMNLYPEEIEAPPTSKSTYGVLTLNGSYYTQGQHIQLQTNINCYGVGDCLAGGQFIKSSGGYRDNSDEGAHPYDLAVEEDDQVFAGVCATGCTTGSTSLVVTVAANGQGDGRFLADTAAAKTLSTGTIVGGGRGLFATAQFSGTSFPVSVFLATAAKVTSQATNTAPGTVTVAIATSGVPAGFATNTAALPATTGTACVADVATLSTFPNYEMAPYTVVDGTHLQLTLNKPHNVGAAMAVGGLCGYGIHQTVDDVGPIKQVFPIVGSTDATDIYYAGALTEVLGTGNTSGYRNFSSGIGSVVRSGNVVTMTVVGGLPAEVNGLAMTVSGVADPSYNGTFTVSTTSAYTLTYSNSGPDSTSSGGTLSFLTGGYAMYPIAEVLSVYNPATHAVDGSFTLAPNTVAWAAGDPVEEPHYYQQNTSADSELIRQYVPRPTQFVGAGKVYDGNVTVGLRGWQVINDMPVNYYLGDGGTHNLPDDAYEAVGPWTTDFEVDAGAQAIVRAHCNLRSCNRWNSAYDLFLLDSAVAPAADAERFDPASDTVSWVLQGATYSFAPAGFTAPTINVGTLNATTINGGVSGTAITSGTVSAARLPLFGPSGTSHAAGIVPDPGATAGATRYLREDGTWDVPAGGSGGGGGSPTGAAGGDLAGSYPNPTVAAVHATSGTLDGVVTGGTTPATGSFTHLTATNAGPPFLTTNTTVTTYTEAGEFTCPNLVSGTYCFINVGTSPSTNDEVGFNFHYVAAGSTANSAVLDFYGSSIQNQTWFANGDTTIGSATDQGALFSVGSSGQFKVDGTGTVTSSQYLGPASAPSGGCATNGAWVFSQDGHATFCASGTWVTKL
jgi:hypothetical protein